MFRLTKVLVLICLLAQPVLAAETTHPIDIWHNQAMETCDGSTHGMLQVQYEAYTRWDQELNRVYGELLKKLTPAGKQALKVTQRAWISYKETLEKNLGIIFAGGVGCGGTIDQLTHSSIIVDTTRGRTLELLSLLNQARENEE